jgi:hypothetical protein
MIELLVIGLLLLIYSRSRNNVIVTEPPIENHYHFNIVILTERDQRPRRMIDG